MLIREIKENQNKVREWNANLEKLKKEMPNYNWDKCLIKTIDDKFKPYKNWICELKNHIQEENSKIRLIKDEEIDFSGVFITGNNPNHDIELLTDMKVVKENNQPYEYYGVCDNATQVIKYYKDLLNKGLLDKNKDYIISLAVVYKAIQPKHNGWRWHKNGQYIGVQNPSMEYIHDEDEIDLVYNFTILAVEKNI